MLRIQDPPSSTKEEEVGTVLDQIAEAGYTGTELGPYGYLPFDVAQLKDELGGRGLTLISASISDSTRRVCSFN